MARESVHERIALGHERKERVLVDFFNVIRDNVEGEIFLLVVDGSGDEAVVSLSVAEARAVSNALNRAAAEAAVPNE